MSVAFFVPHLGCPHDCSFCNQRVISGAEHPVTPDEVEQTLRAVVEREGGRAAKGEIAFFGGSFTAIDRDYRNSLLQAAYKHCKEGYFTGIRVSTRPDYIDKTVLSELKAYGVIVVELGAQSADDMVLQKNLRGHTARDIREAAELVKEFNFTLILQMMTGLYGDSNDGAMYTAQELADLKPDGVRIYPAITLRGTCLEKLMLSGEYRPQTLDEAVLLCARLLRFFKSRKIPVIRLGLHDSEGLAENRVAGPYHPAFRELCEGMIMSEDILSQIREKGIFPGKIDIRLPAAALSKLTGHGRAGLKSIETAGYQVRLLPDASALVVTVEKSEGERTCG